LYVVFPSTLSLCRSSKFLPLIFILLSAAAFYHFAVLYPVCFGGEASAEAAKCYEFFFFL
jgi:hypothetical protein